MSLLTSIDSAALRRAFAHYPSGVAALTGRVGADDHVLVASSFTVGVSLEPPLVMFAIQRSSTTWPKLRRAPIIGISVLAADQGALCRQLAARDSSGRWLGVATTEGAGGALLIDGAPLQFEAQIHAEVPAGDHEVIVLEVQSLVADHDREPLLFHGSRFRAIA